MRPGCARTPQAARLAKHFAPPGHQTAEHRFLHGAQVRQHGKGRRLTALNPREPIHVERKVAGNPCLRRRLLQRVVELRMQLFERVFETGGGQVFLALEIIGDAGGIQSDAARDIGKGHALGALFINRLRGGGKDRVAFGAEALGASVNAIGARRQRFHRRSLTASFRRNSPFCATGRMAHSYTKLLADHDVAALYRMFGTV